MKKSGKRSILLLTVLLLTLLMTMSLVACNNKNEAKLILDKSIVSVDVGDSVTLKATVTGLKSYDIVWTSDNENTATVVAGVVTGVAVGTATITATAGDVSAECVVTVRSNVYPTITLSQNAVEMRLGSDPITVSATVRYSGKVVTPAVLWKSDNESVATVSNGAITAVAVGTAKITASTTYNGNYAEKWLTVTVNPDLLIAVDKESVPLYTYAIDADHKTLAEVNAEVRVNGAAIPTADVAFSSNDTDATIVSIVEDGNKITLTAVGAGAAVITATYTYEGTVLSTVINVTVERPVINTEDTFTVNILDERDVNLALDLSGYDWAEEVEGLYVADEKVSSDDAPSTLLSSWLATQSAGTEKELTISMGTYAATAILRMENEYRTIKSAIAVSGASNSLTPYTTNLPDIGFSEGDKVDRFFTGGMDMWNGRLKTGNLSGYDWWSFDISISEPLSRNIAFWIGGNHVVYLEASGKTSLDAKDTGGYTGDHDADSCLKVYDKDGKPVRGAMQPNQKYTIEISLAHRGALSNYDFIAVDCGANIYLANQFACTNQYYDEHIAETRQTLTALDAEFEVEKFDAATHTLQFASTIGTVKEMLIGDTSISDAATPNKLDATWLAAQKTGFVEFDIKLNDNTIKKGGVRILHTGYTTPKYVMPENRSAQRTSLTNATDVPEAYGFSQNQNVYKYVTGMNENYMNRIRTADLKEYDWWMIDIVFENAVSAGELITFFVGGTSNDHHIVNLKLSPLSTEMWKPGVNYSGTVAEHAENTCIKIFAADGYPVIGSLKAKTRYTIEVNLDHASTAAWYDFGYSGTNTIYIGNSVVCSDDYYQSNIFSKRPVAEQLELFTVEKYDPETFALDFSQYEWGNMVSGLYEENTDTLISTVKTPKTISAEWISTQQPEIVRIDIKLSNNQIIKGALTINSTDYSTLSYSAEGRWMPQDYEISEFSGDKTAVGFAANDTVYEYIAKGGADDYGRRIKTIVKETDDWWIFDMTLSSEMTGRIVLFSGHDHAAEILPNGAILFAQAGKAYTGTAENHLYDNCVKIYDASGNLYRGKLQANVKYTFEVSMKHAGSDTRNYIVGPVGTMYIGNSFSCSDRYYDVYVKGTRQADTTVKFNIEKSVDGSAITLDLSAYANVEGLYVGAQRISVEGTPAVLDQTFLNGIENCYYDFEIRFTDDTPAVKATLFYLIRVKINTPAFFNPTNAASTGATLTTFEGDKTAIGFTQDDSVLAFTSGGSVDKHTENRLLMGTRNAAYEWLIFDISIAAERTSKFVFWVGNNHPVTIQANGETTLWVRPSERDHNENACVKVYDSKGDPVYSYTTGEDGQKVFTGEMLPNTKYTVMVHLSSEHQGGNDYTFGISGANTTYYIANAFQCTSSYYNTHFAPTAP